MLLPFFRCAISIKKRQVIPVQAGTTAGPEPSLNTERAELKCELQPQTVTTHFCRRRGAAADWQLALKSQRLEGRGVSAGRLGPHKDRKPEHTHTHTVTERHECVRTWRGERTTSPRSHVVLSRSTLKNVPRRRAADEEAAHR